MGQDDGLVLGLEERRCGDLSGKGLTGLPDGPAPRGPGAIQRALPAVAEHVLDGVRNARAGVPNHGPGDLVDALDEDAGPAEPRHRLRAGEPVDLGGEVIGQVAGVGRQQHARPGVSPGEIAGAVDGDDSLSGARAPGQAEGALAGPLRVLALLGVEEDAPCAEVAALNDPAQLVIVLDRVEGHAGGGQTQAGEELLVLRALDDGGPVESEVAAHLLQRSARRQLQECVGLPLHARGVDDIEQLRLGGRGERTGGQLLVHAEPGVDVLRGQALLPSGGLLRDGRAPRRDVGGNRQGGSSRWSAARPGRSTVVGDLTISGERLDGSDNAVHLGHPVDGIRGQASGARYLNGLVVRPDPVEPVDGAEIALHLEQDGPEAVIHSARTNPRVGGGLDGLDVQTGEGVIGLELLQEGVRLLVDGRIHTVLGIDQHQGGHALFLIPLSDSRARTRPVRRRPRPRGK